MKIALLSIGVIVFSIGASAAKSSCVVTTSVGKRTVSLIQYMPTGGTVQVGNEVPQNVIRRVSLNFTAQQVDQCRFGFASDESFKTCLQSKFGSLDEYREALPVTLAYIRFEAKRNLDFVSFNTDAVASGKMHYLAEFNPAFGTSAFVQFFDKNQNLVGQIYEPGLGMMLDCK